MRTIAVLPLLALLFFLAGAAPIPASRIEVYYFHTTKRSQTSRTIETVSRNAVLSLYPVKVKRGEMIFRSLDLAEKEGIELGTKFGIRKESLVVILLQNRVDITKQAKKYADKQPEKLTEEIKNAVEKLIQQERDAQSAAK